AEAPGGLTTACFGVYAWTNPRQVGDTSPCRLDSTSPIHVFSATSCGGLARASDRLLGNVALRPLPGLRRRSLRRRRHRPTGCWSLRVDAILGLPPALTRDHSPCAVALAKARVNETVVPLPEKC